MKLKHSAHTEGVMPCVYYVLGVAEVIYKQHGFESVATSLNDSHETRPDSLHNKGLACDLRTRNIPQSTLAIIVSDMKAILSPLGYDVVLESDHIHVEFDMKNKLNWVVSTD